jgi:uncharacterized protein YqgV (UPF0045/DUF77 family)
VGEEVLDTSELPFALTSMNTALMGNFAEQYVRVRAVGTDIGSKELISLGVQLAIVYVWV